MSSPIKTYNITADGTWQEFVVPENINDLSIHARGSADILISDQSDGSVYWTIKADTGLSIDSFNMSGQSIYLKASTSVIIEIIAKEGC